MRRDQSIYRRICGEGDIYRPREIRRWGGERPGFAQAVLVLVRFHFCVVHGNLIVRQSCNLAEVDGWKRKNRGVIGECKYRRRKVLLPNRTVRGSLPVSSAREYHPKATKIGSYQVSWEDKVVAEKVQAHRDLTVVKKLWTIIESPVFDVEVYGERRR